VGQKPEVAQLWAGSSLVYDGEDNPMKLLTDRTLAGCTCAVFGLVWLLVGSFTLMSGPEIRKERGLLAVGFGALCLVAAVFAWYGKRGGWLMASLLFLAFGAFAVLGTIGWQNRLTSSILPFCVALWFFRLFLVESKRTT
jgi:hypothetical protein